MKLFVAIFIFLSTQAQASVKNYSRHFGLALINESHDYNLDFSPSFNPNNVELRYEPNTATLSGVQVTGFGFTLAYMQANIIAEEDETKFGSTSYEDIRGALFLGKNDQYVITGFYNRYKGLFIENSDYVNPSLTDADPRIQRDDIEVFNSGVALTYVFSGKDYSAAAALVQSAQQTKSGGSWLIKGSFDTTDIDADQPIIPGAVQSDFGNDADLRKGTFVTTSAQLGYGHTFVWKNTFVMFAILFGRGYQVRTYQVGNEEFDSSTATSKSSIAYSLGYNGRHFFTTLAYVYDETRFKTESLELENGFGSIRLSIGGRL